MQSNCEWPNLGLKPKRLPVDWLRIFYVRNCECEFGFGCFRLHVFASSPWYNTSNLLIIDAYTYLCLMFRSEAVAGDVSMFSEIWDLTESVSEDFLPTLLEQSREFPDATLEQTP